jgi:hypothetical protein
MAHVGAADLQRRRASCSAALVAPPLRARRTEVARQAKRPSQFTPRNLWLQIAAPLRRLLWRGSLLQQYRPRPDQRHQFRLPHRALRAVRAADRLRGHPRETAPDHLPRRPAGPGRHLLSQRRAPRAPSTSAMGWWSPAPLFWGGHVFLLGLLTRSDRPAESPSRPSPSSVVGVALPRRRLRLRGRPTLAGPPAPWLGRSCSMSGSCPRPSPSPCRPSRQQHVPGRQRRDRPLGRKPVRRARRRAAARRAPEPLVGYAGAALIFLRHHPRRSSPGAAPAPGCRDRLRSTAPASG